MNATWPDVALGAMFFAFAAWTAWLMNQPSSPSWKVREDGVWKWSVRTCDPEAVKNLDAAWDRVDEAFIKVDEAFREVDTAFKTALKKK